MKKMNRNRIVVFFTTVVLILSLVIAFGKNVINDMNLGLDLRGGFAIVYEVEPLDGKELPDLSTVVTAVRKRIDVLGVNEPYISIEGENRIRVELAGVQDQEQARKVISSTANLTFRDSKDKLLMDATSIAEGGASLVYNLGQPQVSLKIKDQAKFATITKELASKSSTGENLIVAWLDFEEGKDSYQLEKAKANPKYISAASVSSEINGDAIISGNFTSESAKELASLINAGSLPVKMKQIQTNVVSAQFGDKAYNQTMFAGALGIVAVMIFMILAYRIMGVISAITLSAYAFFVVLLFNLMGGTFTLSGIAALVLGVGMTVDASVISFERIKDSLYAGRSVKTAVEEGNKRAFTTIFDSQVTTFIAALILFFMGQGSIKGFATMLMMTVVGTFLINVILVKFLLNLLVKSNYLDDKKHWFGIKNEHIPNLAKGEGQVYFGRFTNIDFVKLGKKVVLVSVAVFVFGIGSAIFNPKPLNLGIDFTSGSKITIQSQTAIQESDVRAIFTENGYTPNQIRFEGEGNKIVTATLNEAIDQDKLVSIKAAIKAKYNTEANDSIVSPKIGQELARSAIIISAIAWIVIMIYISIRFKWDYAVSGLAALVHDVLFLVAVFAIVRFEINTEFIAVILSIIGYSIDDTIVIFDRIRENVNQYTRDIKKEEYKKIVNDALQQVTMRSLINTFTTILPIFFLLGLGAPEVFVFNFAMLIGLIAGAYSSIFIAAQLWLWIRMKYTPKLHKKKKVRKSVDSVQEMIIPGIND